MIFSVFFGGGHFLRGRKILSEEEFLFLIGMGAEVFLWGDVTRLFGWKVNLKDIGVLFIRARKPEFGMTQRSLRVAVFIVLIMLTSLSSSSS